MWLLFVVCCLLCVAWCLLFDVCHVCCLLVVVRCVLIVVCCVVVWCLLFGRVPFVVCCLLFGYGCFVVIGRSLWFEVCVVCCVLRGVCGLTRVVGCVLFFVVRCRVSLGGCLVFVLDWCVLYVVIACCGLIVVVVLVAC